MRKCQKQEKENPRCSQSHGLCGGKAPPVPGIPVLMARRQRPGGCLEARNLEGMASPRRQPCDIHARPRRTPADDACHRAKPPRSIGIWVPSYFILPPSSCHRTSQRPREAGGRPEGMTLAFRLVKPVFGCAPDTACHLQSPLSTEGPAGGRAYTCHRDLVADTWVHT